MTIAIKWLQPSWTQIKINHKIIYIDPAYLRTYYTRYSNKIEFSKWPDPIDGLPEKLPKADIILITHDHADHCKKITVDRLRKKNTTVLGPRRCAKKIGDDLRIVEPGQEICLGKIKIKATEAYNTEEGSSTQKVHHKGNGVGYLISVKGQTVYHAGDTDFTPEMKQLGGVDVALLPIGGTYTMDIREAVKAAMEIKPAAVIPIHHLKARPEEFQKKLKSRSDIKLIPMQIGAIYKLPKLSER
jgi:L-ascorbate metabolism protein UlaG (beta-lactamase superfamily)